jgi:hypothetical protein
MKKIKRKDVGGVVAQKNRGARARPTPIERTQMEAPTQEEIDQALGEAGNDQIAFSIQAHPITQEPQFVVHARAKNGDRADVKMAIPEAINLGAQITAQATSFMTVQSVAQIQAQAAAQQIVRP